MNTVTVTSPNNKLGLIIFFEVETKIDFVFIKFLY